MKEKIKFLGTITPLNQDQKRENIIKLFINGQNEPIYTGKYEAWKNKNGWDTIKNGFYDFIKDKGLVEDALEKLPDKECRKTLLDCHKEEIKKNNKKNYEIYEIYNGFQLVLAPKNMRKR